MGMIENVKLLYFHVLTHNVLKRIFFASNRRVFIKYAFTTLSCVHLIW